MPKYSVPRDPIMTDEELEELLSQEDAQPQNDHSDLWLLGFLGMVTLSVLILYGVVGFVLYLIARGIWG